MTKAEKAKTVNKIKALASTFVEALRAEKFEDAFEPANELNKFLKSEEVTSLEETDLKGIDFAELKKQVAKYFWVNTEYRKARGALIKKADHISNAVGL